MQANKLKLTTLSMAAAMLIVAGQSALAHTRLNVPTLTEGTRVLNHMVIGDNCAADAGDGRRVIGTSVVFPDGRDSTVLVDGQPHEGELTDFLTNFGNNFQLVFDRSAFDYMDEKTDPLGNVTGFWAGGGPGVPGNLNAFTPVRTTAARIEPTSCAKSVRLTIQVADICNITRIDNLGTDADFNVKLWTHNALGTPFDRQGSETDNGPASLMITRDLENNPLPEGCGEGVAVEVRPSAAQTNRDMPIRFEGQQIWPQP